MIAVTRGTGAALIVVGVTAYAIAQQPHWTALLPAMLGAVVLLLGLVAGKERLRPHAIHTALVVSLLGLLGSLPRTLPLMTGGDTAPGAWASALTVLLTLVYIVLGVRSFVAARRARQTAT